MSGAWVLVWLGASAPTLDQRLAIESYELANPLFMSVDGILRYLRKRGG